MYRLFLAIRYVWSRPISWISMVGIWLSVMALIVTFSVMSGLLAETVSLIRGITPDITLKTDSDPEPTLDAVKAALADIPGVAGLTPEVTRPAMLRVERIDQTQVMGQRRYTERNFVRVVGLDPRSERAVGRFDGSMLPPSDPRAVDDPSRPFWVRPERVPPTLRNAELRVVLVGSKVWDFYRLQKGEQITLVTLPDDLDVEEEVRPLSQRFLVGGALQTGHPEQDASTIYMHYLDAKEFAVLHQFTEIGVTAEPGVGVDAVKDRVAAGLVAAGLDLKAETWRERNAEYLGAVETERVMMSVLLFFFVAVACFNVFATLTVMVTDKVRDIGVLNAMGATAQGLLSVFVGAGLIMAVLSATLGCLSGFLLAQHINRLDDLVFAVCGLRIFPAGMYAFSKIPVVIHPNFIALAFVMTLLTALACALVPALRAARLDPVEALRSR